jgi:ABC-type nitrate/sulfonate/bicarbonate transport system, permease component
VIAIALLALIWFSPDSVPVFIGLLTMFPLVCMNVMDGMKSVDPSLVEMAEFYKVGRRRIIREVYVPAIAPFIYSGISSAIGIGWRAIIVGEVLSQPKYGIGTRMQTAQTFLNVDALIAWTIIAVLLSYGFESLLRVSERRTVRWINF